MGSPTTSPQGSIDKETWRAYYLLQYERINQHENGRLHVTNTILAATVVALGLTTLAPDRVVNALAVVPLAVAVANLLVRCMRGTHEDGSKFTKREPKRS